VVTIKGRVKISLRELSKSVTRNVTVELEDDTATPEELQRLGEQAREKTKDLYNSLESYINTKNLQKASQQ